MKLFSGFDLYLVMGRVLIIASCYFFLPFSSVNAQGLPPVFELSDLDGVNGFSVDIGFVAADSAGLAFDFTTIGDINGDGISDIALGFAGIDANGGRNVGGVLVVYGRRGGLSNRFPFFPLRAEKGFVLLGESSFDLAGGTISAAGDVNNDGIDDMIIGASSVDVNGVSDAGVSYVVFGRTGEFPALLNLSELDGTNGFVINGIAFADFSGGAVSKAGDINADGVDDIIIGAAIISSSGLNRPGAAYVVFGSDSLVSATFDLSSLDGTNGFVIPGIAAGDETGSTVGAAGDINGDGIDDLLVGKFGNFPSSSTVYVIFGKETEFEPVFDLSSLNGSNGFTLKSFEEGDVFGARLADVGDFNGDGLDDIIISALEANPDGRINAGSAYMIFGRTTAFPSQVDVTTLDSSNGFRINGITAADNAGISVSGAGDINDDGFADIIVGASNASPNGKNRAGSTYIIYGSSTLFPAVFELSTLDALSGLVVNGPIELRQSGQVVGGAGDFNGDGIDDFLIGSGVSHEADSVVYGISNKTGVTTLFSSVLPTARSGFIDGPVVTIFASVINAGANRADNCRFELPDSADIVLSYTPTNSLNALVGTPDTNFPMNPGETKSFILSFSFSAINEGEKVFPAFICDNVEVAEISGVNTVFLSIEAEAVADILSISATPDSNGIITIPQNGISFMSVSATNIGVGDIAGSSNAEISVSVDSGGVSLPLFFQICETDIAGTCLAPPSSTAIVSTIGSGVSFFAVFVSDQGSNGISLDPANARVFLRFTDINGKVRSETSAAVTVQ